MALDEANALQRITSQVLKFPGFRQGFWGGAFDPDEDIEKIRLHHGFDQLGPLSEINRCLGVKQNRIAIGRLNGQMLQDRQLTVNEARPQRPNFSGSRGGASSRGRGRGGFGRKRDY